MSMEINGYNSNVNKYYDVSKVNNTKEEVKPENANTTGKTNADTAVVYEKSANVSSNKATYEINKKSSTDRAAIVEQMKKAEADNRQSLINMVREMMNTQAGKQKTADGFSAFGGTVTEEARRKAQESISEDGYWGVKQTSQRLFDFASALAGDDVGKMKKMQEAMNKGINQAAEKLGGLPSISQQTQEAANNLFEEYYKSKGQDIS